MLSGCVLGVGLQRRSIRRGYKPDCNLRIVLVQGFAKNRNSPYRSKGYSIVYFQRLYILTRPLVLPKLCWTAPIA